MDALKHQTTLADIKPQLMLGFGPEGIRSDSDHSQTDQRVFDSSQRKTQAPCLVMHIKPLVAVEVIALWRRSLTAPNQHWAVVEGLRIEPLKMK
ncbi:hypothetical protein EVAR_8095_1 [Eumeta japonica]|uniref:Uncharacterized protein n=1 Tax=Eumeta variegata TaxID=151549 RepID=A0A4C1TSP0_EUMVA|nr:hypothetical protein EVAR_8095_1 [Eumeta japonica]